MGRARGEKAAARSRSLALSVVSASCLALAAVADARTCEVALWLDASPLLGALQVEIDYSAAAARFAPGQAGPLCSGDAWNTLALIVPGSDGTLNGSFVSLAGFAGPQKLAHCFFEDTDGTATAADVAILVTDSTDVNGEPVQGVSVYALLPDCGDTTTTTSTSTTSTTTSTTSTTTSTTSTTTTSTTSTSTTTLAEFCGNGVVDGDEQCDDGNDLDGDGCDADCTTLVLCGDANGNASVQTGDALLVLRSAIGQPVQCPLERCDSDGDTKLRTADALRVLKRAVGQSVVMACPHLD